MEEPNACRAALSFFPRSGSSDIVEPHSVFPLEGGGKPRPRGLLLEEHNRLICSESFRCWPLFFLRVGKLMVRSS